VPGALQLSLYALVQDLLLDRVTWFLRNGDLKHGLAEVVSHYRSGIGKAEAALDQALPVERHAARSTRASELIAAGVPDLLAHKIASLPELTSAPDIVLIADRTQKPVETVTGVYFAAGAYFQIDRIIEAARLIEVADHFDRLALDRALVEIAASMRRLTAEMLATGANGAAAVETWVDRRRREVERVRTGIHEIAASGLTLSKLAVAVSLLADLAEH
jgi:glutamate dehydrogenase